MRVIPVPAAVPGHGASDWNAQDDIDQDDALKALQFLGEQIGRSSELEAKLAEASSHQEQGDGLIHLQIQLASLKESLAKEREQKESMQHQMMCLEQELDAKEATINDLERDLERKDEELSQVRRGQKRAIGCDDSRVKALEHQLHDRQQQLEAKDGHITRLLNVLRQHRGKYFDEESTVCPSDRSVAIFNMSG
jgi:predicted RNase H-like nuclease (RuvC/YqgF family)